MQDALDRVRGQLGREHPIIIGDRKIICDEKLESINPSRIDEVVGVFQAGGADLVDPAIEAAEQAFKTWSHVPASERVDYVLEMARLMRERRLDLAAWMVIEVGKSWVEADADVAEAVDFCEFYGREMLRLAGAQQLVPYAPEENELRYIPLGVAVVIPPWNFPLAILTGMTVATFVAGNTTILKPSSDSPAIAYQLMKLIEEVGLPAGVVNFVSGGGRVVGEPLIRHPRTRMIAFTGSKEVGLRINELAAQTPPGQIWIKRVIAEMGGKDSIVVDEDCDLDVAAEGVIRSAFGYQGQKCSACSRAIVVDSVYDEFLDKLVEAEGRIVKEGNTEAGDVNFGPVSSARAYETILGYIETGKKEGRLLVGGEKGSAEGFYIRPTIIADVQPDAVISQEEIFGPVLAVLKARDYDDALEIANNTVYGLTGAVFSNDPEKQERAKNEFHVGNLYINRGCTGALVGVHPFGGFNMSGTDSKAGGRDYLLLFTQGKSIARLR